MKTLSIRNLDKIVKASADSNRIRILNILRGKRMCVCEIAFVLGISQPSVSRHLKKLKIAGFIDSETEGIWTNYYLSPQNPYTKNFLKHLQSWIVADDVLEQDKDKVKKADRKTLSFL